VDIPGRFASYEAASYDRINALIDRVDEERTGMKKEVFRSFLGKVYKRSK
jgi:farnesyl diphosphate synthase